MARFVKCIMFCALTVAGASAQQAYFSIRLVNGKTGQSLGGIRLLVFGGSTPEGARFQDHSFTVTTNKDGVAQFQDTASVSWVQVFADGLTLCQDKPNLHSFSVEEIVKRGVVTPNKCGKLNITPTSGYITVAARPSSFMEKMGH